MGELSPVTLKVIGKGRSGYEATDDCIYIIIMVSLRGDFDIF